jgi:hypothetical protein
LNATLRNWKNIGWILEKNGTLRDIYFLKATISDWGKLVDFSISEEDMK